MNTKLDDFGEVWVVWFDCDRLVGERPRPVGLVARELCSRQVVRLGQEGLREPQPPYPVDREALFVTYDAAPALGCHLALGWPMPAAVLDLHAEFRCANSGLLPRGDFDLAAALAHHGMPADGHEPVEALPKLLEALLPAMSLPHALLRGRYLAAVARMEWTGVPIDLDSFQRLRNGWEGVQGHLIQQVDQHYGVFDGRKFSSRKWAAWLNRRHIPWPRLAPGRLDLSLDTFTEMAKCYPEVQPMTELRASLAQLKLFRLAVDQDGRNRCPLRPFASKTGRNQPSTAAFIFGPAAWLRGLIKPSSGFAVAYVDYEQQEFGIAAALSDDPAMKAAYRTGDPYLTFAKQTGAVPTDATKATHRDERERFKLCALGVQYGMQARSLALRLGVSPGEAQKFLHLHRTTYPTYWEWSKAVGRQARQDGALTATYGWKLHVGPGANPRSVRNWPLQANGAEMLRLACCFLTEAGVGVCAPVHDALLIEAPAEDIERAVATCQRQMERASELVLEGFPLRTEAKVVRYPDRYMDPRGQAMWETVFGLLGGRTMRRCA